MDCGGIPVAEAEGRLLARVCSVVGALGADPQANIGLLTRSAGELLGADAAVYYRKRGGAMFAVARWGLPDDFNPLASSAPDSYSGFSACAGRAVTGEGGVELGLLRVLYSRPPRSFPHGDILMNLFATVIGRQERRLSDDNEQRRLADSLRQAAKMEVVARLIGGIAHDFNNCLTGICGNAELLAHRDLPAEACSLADEIAQGGRHAAALTRQLLGFSRKRPLEPVVLDLNAAVTSLHMLLRRTLGERIAVELDLAPGADCIRADAGQIDQVVLNLAINARDAMPQGGRLTLKTRVEELADGAGPEALRGGRERYVVLTVRDTGCGMTPEVRGTGLGLAAVLGIAKDCGGTVVVDAAPGRDAEFRVYFPALPGAAPAPAAAEPLVATAGAAPRGRVLLVEDEQSVRSLLAKVLAAAGYEVREAGDGESALRVAEEGGRFDLVISDIVMPGMNGYQFAQGLRERRPEAPFLFISGYADEDTLQSASNCPNSAVLMKPFSPSEFVRLVRKISAV